MSAAELLIRLQRRGVEVTAKAGELVVDAPAGALSPALRQELREQKRALIELLTVAVMPTTQNMFDDAWQDPPKVIKRGTWRMVELVLDGQAVTLPAVTDQFERGDDGRLVARYTPDQLTWALAASASCRPFFGINL